VVPPPIAPSKWIGISLPFDVVSACPEATAELGELLDQTGCKVRSICRSGDPAATNRSASDQITEKQ
jgi:hypothetical protein